jgi:AcrR family transcriptional regulator
MELISSRDYDGITVQDIVDRADVGRSTFYAHFESKEDLLFAGVDRHLMTLVEERPAGLTPEEDAARFRFSLPMLRHVRDQRRFFEATILGGSDSRLREVSAGIITDMVTAELDRLEPDLASPIATHPDIRPAELRGGYARAVVGAFMGLLDWWLRSADHLPGEVVDDLFHRTAMGLLRGRAPLALPSEVGAPQSIGNADGRPSG